MRGQSRVELLAPAGSAAAFYGAVKAGADAVYLAGNRFGARAYAENFTQESLVGCIRYAHLSGRRVYLAVNTLFKERELAELYDYLAPFYEAGVDAVIVQDLGVLRYIREHFPGLALHASTQMTLCSAYGAGLLRRMGADRIVPARELCLEEIEGLRDHGDLQNRRGLRDYGDLRDHAGLRDGEASGQAAGAIEIEAFIHGAMCYCYSGQCLFSSILGGRSGNRGRCAQPCRLPYSVGTEGRSTGECYPLSLKDMCTIEHIPDLIEAGIDSFKIEGRMKKPEYAAGVTAVYRKYIDRYERLRQSMSREEAAAAYHVEKEDLRRLSSLYVRCGIQDGYYFRQNGREMVALDNPAYGGSDEAMLAGIAAKYLDAPLKQPVSVRARFQTGEPASVILRWRELSAQVTGAVVEPAVNQPITEENIKKQLGKLGDSCFAAEDIQVFVSENSFYPLRQINELRREAVAKLEQMINKALCPERVSLCLEKRKLGRPVQARETAAEEEDTDTGGPGWAVSLQTLEQLCELERWVCLGQNAASRQESASSGRAMPRGQAVRRIYVEGDLLLQSQERTLAICGGLREYCGVWVTLPYIFRAQDVPYMEQVWNIVSQSGFFQGFLARSLDEVGFLAERETAGAGLKYRADACLYTWNREALRELSEWGVSGFCMPYELKGGEQRELLRVCGAPQAGEMAHSFEKIVYSRIPMMVTANCLLRTTDSCRKDSGKPVTLTDRYRKKFPVARNCLHCMNIIYNSVPFSLHQEHDKWRGICRRLDFALETPAQMRAVLGAFWRGDAFPFREYTTGHEKRGVE